MTPSLCFHRTLDFQGLAVLFHQFESNALQQDYFRRLKFAYFISQTERTVPFFRSDPTAIRSRCALWPLHLHRGRPSPLNGGARPARVTPPPPDFRPHVRCKTIDCSCVCASVSPSRFPPFDFSILFFRSFLRTTRIRRAPLSSPDTRSHPRRGIKGAFIVFVLCLVRRAHSVRGFVLITQI